VNLYDLIVVALIALLAYRGFRAGLVRELLAWAAFAFGLVLALRFDGRVGGWLARVHEFGPGTRRILAFVVILVAVEVAVGLLAGPLSRSLAHVPLVGHLDRLGGLLFGALLALIPVWLVTGALLLEPHSLLPLAGAASHSETAHLLRALTPHWEHSLRACVDRLTAGHSSPRLTRELRRLTGGQVRGSGLQ
jgi:uncharacterized membrane protein required for colicin V production